MKAHPIIRNIAVHIYYLVLRSKAIGKRQKRLKEPELTAENGLRTIAQNVTVVLVQNVKIKINSNIYKVVANILLEITR